MTFKDHFSKQADEYAKFRPVYPAALFAYLASQVSGHDLAWDCGTGNGQAALGLAAHFDRVIATDAAEAQIRNAIPHEKILYKVAPAERTDIAAGSVDLVTVAQALHWVDLSHFYTEARRVLRPAGVLAAWCYGLNEIEPGIDEIVQRYYKEIVGPYWPPERRLIDERYQTIPFASSAPLPAHPCATSPFAEWTPPAFHMEAQWNLDEFIGYLGTWSATRRYREQRSADPLIPLRVSLERAWGAPHAKLIVKWPIHLRIGKV